LQRLGFNPISYDLYRLYILKHILITLGSLINAIENKYTESIELLLTDLRFDPSANDNEAIRMVSIFRYTEIVEFCWRFKN